VPKGLERADAGVLGHTVKSCMTVIERWGAINNSFCIIKRRDWLIRIAFEPFFYH
jgi:hypothetical protein